MDNNTLMELKNRLAALPVLKDRLKKQDERIGEADLEVNLLLQKYEKESLDVEQIQKNSLSATILKLVGKYEDRVDKESREMFHAKTEYDSAVNRLKELKHEREEIRRRLSDLTDDKRIYESELDSRERKIKSGFTDEVSVKYSKLEDELNSIRGQLAETEEALRAARRALSTAKAAMDQLDDAESWATYDIWFSKGIISHMAKYNRIDRAEELFDKLASQIVDLRNELKDINLTSDFSLSSIDSTTRAIDFWFDNIFTDMAVRDQIRDNLDQIRGIYGKIDRVIDKLVSIKSDINRQIQETEKKKDDLIISYEG
jgi:chromosome segregation ATPase